jgi:hypothetical protein
MELVKFAVKVAAVIAVFRIAESALNLPASVTRYLP